MRENPWVRENPLLFEVLDLLLSSLVLISKQISMADPQLISRPVFLKELKIQDQDRTLGE